MKKTFEVKFKVNYRFNTEKQYYEAEVTIYIPADSLSLLHKSFRNENINVFNYPLEATWGNIGDGTRYNRLYLRNESNKKLKKEVDKLIRDTIDILQKVKRDNEKKLEKVNADSEIIYKI